ncbi:Mis12-Mtw1 protein family-domain-containing protein [Polychytrium aggregatum]|uniref:Mis12-Mtw1 protein family-domain-containing protein n=1 Tax=Polychytrium aggregatum TaxID=110093 RepID=UPI0022FE7603|nr:Mis12-Mtw1 protein family-domain-containing protein [Polychytrium aggregatum]KAI9208596.1 Mis12-Mtw1 protein family-domain-containing protein [Polychytrium aggregatum]
MLANPAKTKFSDIADDRHPVDFDPAIFKFVTKKRKVRTIITPQSSVTIRQPDLPAPSNGSIRPVADTSSTATEKVERPVKSALKHQTLAPAKSPAPNRTGSSSAAANISHESESKASAANGNLGAHAPSAVPMPDPKAFLLESSKYLKEYTVPLAVTPERQTEVNQRRKSRTSLLRRRRSSLGLRGKRVSEVNKDTGLCSLPHPDIQPSEYYKHIDSESFDPVRMRQLLFWQTQILERKKLIPNATADEDKTFKACAKQITQGIADRSINTSWFQRPSAPQKISTDGKIPHPQNTQNTEVAAQFERVLEELEAEEQEWIARMSARQIQIGEETQSRLRELEEYCQKPHITSLSLTVRTDGSSAEITVPSYLNSFNKKAEGDDDCLKSIKYRKWVDELVDDITLTAAAVPHQLSKISEYVKENCAPTSEAIFKKMFDTINTEKEQDSLDPALLLSVLSAAEAVKSVPDS